MITELSKNTSPKNIISNEMKIGEIDKHRLSENVKKIVTVLILDMSVELRTDEIEHLIIRICQELFYKRPSMRWGEFKYAIEMGVRGHWNAKGKLSVALIVQWLECYKSEMIAKRTKQNDFDNSEIKKDELRFNPDGQYFAKAMRLRMDNEKLKELPYKYVVDGVKLGLTSEQILEKWQSNSK